MKQVLIGFFVTIIIGLLVWFLLPEIDSPDTSARELELVGIVDSLTSHIAIIEKERDSLLTIPPLIDRQIVYRDAQIDSSIAKDSANALVEFRKSLQDNDIIPDGTDSATNRELGWSAKIMSAKPKLELKVTAYEETVFKDEIIISDLKYQIDGYKQLRRMDKLTIEYKDKQLKVKDSFWYDRFVIVGGVGGGYTGTSLQPILGVMVGIKIWGNE